MKSHIILDTGPLVALLSRTDRFHDWTLETMEGIKSPLLTCEPVVTEACYLLSRVNPKGGSKVMSLLQRNFIKIGFKLSEHYERIQFLLEKYSDTPMDFADACIVCMSEKYSNSSVLTLDSDFRIYRKNNKKVLSLYIPDQL